MNTHRHPSSLLDVRPSRRVTVGVIALLLLLAHYSGTVCLTTSSLPHHSQHFVRKLKHIYFGNILTLFFSCVAIVEGYFLPPPIRGSFPVLSAHPLVIYILHPFIGGVYIP